MAETEKTIERLTARERQETGIEVSVFAEFTEFEVESQTQKLTFQAENVTKQGQDRLNQIKQDAKKSGLSEQEWRDALETWGIKQGLSLFERTAKKIASKFRKVALISMMALPLAGHAENKEPAEEQKIERLESKNLEEFESALAARLLTDKKERIFFKINDEIIEVKGGKENSGFVSLAEMEKLLNKKGAKKAEIIHTHPLNAYAFFGYGPKGINSMRSSPDTIPPMTFSQVDVVEEIRQGKYFSDRGLEVTSAVYDPTGKWEIAYDWENPQMQIIKKANEEVTKEFLKLFEQTTEEEKKELRKYKDLHPIELIRKAIDDPKLASFAEKVEDLIENLTTKQEKDIEKLVNFIGVSLQMSSVAGNPEPAKQEKIQEVIQKAAEAGIQLKYRAFVK